MESNGRSVLLNRQAVWVFLAMVLVVSGGFEGLAIRYGTGTRPVMWSVAIATLLTLRFLGRDLRSLGWAWGDWKYQWLAFGIPFAYTLVAYLIVWGLDLGGFYDTHFVQQQRESLKLTGWSDSAVIGFYFMLTASFGMAGSLSTALGEEIGWRGFLVPELAKRMPFGAVGLVSGVAWATWHLPLILFAGYHNNDASLTYQMFCFFLFVLSAAMIMAWLRLKSGSLWTGAVFHASHNLFIQTVFVPLTVKYTSTPLYIDELGIVPPCVAAVFALGVWLYARWATSSVHSSGNGTGVRSDSPEDAQ